MPSINTSSKMRSKKITAIDTRKDNIKPIKMRFGVNPIVTGKQIGRAHV